MGKIGKPAGLIRYTSQDGLAGLPTRLIRARTVIYPIIISVAAILFLVILSSKFAFDAGILRMPGAPFSVARDQQVQNNFRIRLVNRSRSEQEYSIRSTNTEAVARWSNEGLIRLAPGESTLAPLDVQFPIQTTSGDGFKDTHLEIADTSGKTRDIPIRLLGPR